MNEKLKLMKEGKISKALITLGLPVTVGLLITSIYNFTDSLFVSWLGTEALGATSIVYPLITLVPGIGFLFGNGGSAYISAIKPVNELLVGVDGDVKTGISIVARALEEPVRQIASNAGFDGSVVCEKVKEQEEGVSFDVLKTEYVDMVSAGIIDPAKVTRSALQNAASIAAILLTTEAIVADIPEPEADMQQPPMY